MGTATGPAFAVFETEPNNTFPGQSATVGTLYQGFLCNISCGTADPIDFYGYAGRTLETDWKFLGWKDVLCVGDPKQMYNHVYGRPTA